MKPSVLTVYVLIEAMLNIEFVELSIRNNFSGLEETSGRTYSYLWILVASVCSCHCLVLPGQ